MTPPSLTMIVAALFLAAASGAFVLAMSDTTTTNVSRTTTSKQLHGLNVAVVGAGPSGLLITHRLLEQGATVALFERRSDPRRQEKESRAYALGIGYRGRTALKSTSQQVWKAVQAAGQASERFDLHFPGTTFKLRLRDARDGQGLEPSRLLFQSDLCRVLTEQLEQLYGSEQRLSFHFDCKVADLNLSDNHLTTTSGTRFDGFDLIIGSDGVKSVVRQVISASWPDFETTIDELPDKYKVVTLPLMPPLLDDSAVALLLPKRGKLYAFVEPTVNNTCCILFTGRDSDDTLLTSDNVTELTIVLQERFPKLAGVEQLAADQLAKESSSSIAYKVTCNTYHYGDSVVLIGDAAHASGGVSGQGVNSALVDAQVLADILTNMYDGTPSSVRAALLAYSQRQVPEGRALYDLSFGPQSKSLLKKLGFIGKYALDSLFKGRFGIGELPLRTKLTTSLESFASIRRSRDKYYDENFPSISEWNHKIADLDAAPATEKVVDGNLKVSTA